MPKGKKRKEPTPTPYDDDKKPNNSEFNPTSINSWLGIDQHPLYQAAHNLSRAAEEGVRSASKGTFLEKPVSVAQDVANIASSPLLGGPILGGPASVVYAAYKAGQGLGLPLPDVNLGVSPSDLAPKTSGEALALLNKISS
jgi:hypothetical protein